MENDLWREALFRTFHLVRPPGDVHVLAHFIPDGYDANLTLRHHFENEHYLLLVEDI